MNGIDPHVLARLARPNSGVRTHVNQHGNMVIREFAPGERYQFDFGACSSANGWMQYDTDQDAWYFGAWVHKARRLIFTYAEGDCTTVACPDALSFNREIASMNRFYGDGFIAIGIDPEAGTSTRWVQDRSVFSIGLLPLPQKGQAA